MSVLYFDQASGEAADPETIAFLTDALARFPANPEGLHREALRSRHAMEDAGRELAELTGLNRHRCLFSTSATALFRLFARYLRQKKHCRVLSSVLSHPALEMALGAGGDCTMLPVTAAGVTFPDSFPELPEWLVLPQVESELGLRGMTGGSADHFRRAVPQMLICCDAVQSFGKEPLVKGDAVIVSGHKIGAPGAAALLYAPERVRGFSDFAEKQRHEAHSAERPEPAFVLAMVDSARRHYAQMERNTARVTELNSFLRNELSKIKTNNGRTTVFPAELKNSSPYILGVLFPGLQSSILLRMLSQREICVGSGAACAAEAGRPSRILAALGYGGEEGRGALRISLSPCHTEIDCRTLVCALHSIAANY